MLVVEPVAADDDRLLAGVEPVEKLAHLLQAVALGDPLLILIGPHVRRRLEHVHVGRPKPVSTLVLVGDRAGVVLHDRPRGVGAELVAPGIVELLDGPDERHVAVAHEVEEGVARRHTPLRDRHHEPEIGSHEPVFEGHDLGIDLVDLVHQPGAWMFRVELLAELRGLVLEVVELPEQPHLLLPREQRHFVKACEVGRQAGGTPHFLDLVVLAGKRLIDHLLGALPREEGVGNVIERQVHHVLRPLGEDHPIDAGLRPPISGGDRFDRFALGVEVVDPLAGLGPEAAVARAKHRRFGVVVVVLLDRVADCLDAAMQPHGDAAMHVGRAGPCRGEPAGPGNDPVVLVVRKLAESCPPLDAVWIGGNEPLHRTRQKADPLPAAHFIALGDQAVLTPPGNRLRGDVEPLRQILDRQHLLVCEGTDGRGRVGHRLGMLCRSVIGGQKGHEGARRVGTHDCSPCQQSFAGCVVLLGAKRRLGTTVRARRGFLAPSSPCPGRESYTSVCRGWFIRRFDS